jgi:diguanylate cyclase (GGDEF)-like protein
MAEQPPDTASDEPPRDDPAADARRRAGGRRDQSARDRLRAADLRDAIADARDLVAATRDRAAAAAAADGRDTHPAEDRRHAAHDREDAARERIHALVDRERMADALALAAIDELTGARGRAAGLAELDHELARCRRTGGRLVAAYVDIVGLKALNDSQGHGAGDDLLRRVVALIRDDLRSYDLIIRVGGDEFVCAMSNMTLLDARLRFDRVAAALSAAAGVGAIRTGLAELAGDETVAELIARADRQLIDGPHASH